jgi:hypothetical protein
LVHVVLTVRTGASMPRQGMEAKATLVACIECIDGVSSSYDAHWFLTATSEY